MYTYQLLSLSAAGIYEWFPVQQCQDARSRHLRFGGIRSKGSCTAKGEGGENHRSKYSAVRRGRGRRGRRRRREEEGREEGEEKRGGRRVGKEERIRGGGGDDRTIECTILACTCNLLEYVIVAGSSLYDQESSKAESASVQIEDE